MEHNCYFEWQQRREDASPLTIDYIIRSYGIPITKDDQESATTITVKKFNSRKIIEEGEFEVQF